MHPYEIQQVMRQRRLDRSFKLNFGSLYHAIEALLGVGHIETVETARDGRRPERTVYSATAAGSEAFRTHLARVVAEPGPEFSTFEAGLSFISYLESDVAVSLLKQRIERIDSDLAEGDAVQATLMSRGLSRLSLIEHEHSQALRRAEKEWVRALVADVQSGKLEWRVGFSEQAQLQRTQSQKGSIAESSIAESSMKEA